MYELRFLNLNEKTYLVQHRYRLQNGLVTPLKVVNDKITIANVFFNELFFNTSNGISRFDQDRIYEAVQFQFEKLDINLGYQWTLQNVKRKIMNRGQVQVSANINL